MSVFGFHVEDGKDTEANMTVSFLSPFSVGPIRRATLSVVAVCYCAGHGRSVSVASARVLP